MKRNDRILHYRGLN
ncbi:hypothetical protein ACXAUC_001273 [Escherichia coli]